jgi:hypothetical protein
MKFRLILIILLTLFISEISYAKKLKKMGSFITSNANSDYARQRSSVVVHGETIHFFYRVGNVLFRNSTGAPFETRLEVRRNMKLVLKTRWALDTAGEADSSHDNKYIKQYANSKNNIYIAEDFRTGSYTAQIFFRDLNTMRETEFSYGFSLTRKDLMKDYLKGDVTGIYKTTWGTLELIQKTHRIRGFFEKNNGRLEGYIKGFKVWGDWVMEPSFRPPLDQGRFIFEFSRDGKKIFGQYRNIKDRQWYSWEGYLVE